MKTDHYHLQIVPLNNIIVHEHFDTSRTNPLIKNIKKDAQLTNPVIVASLGKDRFLELDGMNRISAFKKMGYKNILVQIVDYNDQQNVDLSSWVHLFKYDSKQFIETVSRIPGITVKPGIMENIGHRYIKEKGLGRLCTLCSRTGKVYLVSTSGDLVDKIKKLNEIVSLYKAGITRDVLLPYLNMGDLRFIFNQHPKVTMMLVFPTFTRHQVIKMVEKGGLFPAGLTRHIIGRRCLNVNLSLKVLDNKNSLEKQNQLLEADLRKRSYRIFEEHVVYFE
jgi:hypothetical protein